MDVPVGAGTEKAEEMLALAYIILGMAGVSFALWLAQTSRALEFARHEVEEAWAALRKELMARREMVPYVVAAAHTDASQVVDVIGNACDLADHVATVTECSQAEARLTSALNRLFAMVDAAPETGGRDTLDGLRKRLSDQYTRILMHKEIYNRQAETLNALLDRGIARVFVALGFCRKAALY